MQDVYRSTRRACYAGYSIQAVVNNLAPLLFVIFQKQYGISTLMLGNLILLNFGCQLAVDALSVKLLTRFGYRRMIVLAHISAALGLVFLGVLPAVLPHALPGLIAAVLFYAFGGGILEVAVSPVVEAIPGDRKASTMSFLHSFYCWGQMAVVLLSTGALFLIGEKAWFCIPICWCVLPLCNAVAFARAPMPHMVTGKEGCGAKRLFQTGVFPLFMLFMLAAGAAELTVAQWASYFAEQGLCISKTAGDLFGPCLFAVTMGGGRLLYGIWGHKWNLHCALQACAVLCVAAYLLITLSPWPWLSLCGCALCGFAVSLMWPGTLSYAAGTFSNGGALMFGILALCGDAGCALGPWIAGGVATVLESARAVSAQDGLKMGILVTAVFPIAMLIGTLLLDKRKRREQNGISKTA